MSDTSPIVLCGFMGCGKTTVGKIISKRTELEFIDMDSYIEKKEGCSVKEIFEKHGEEYFRELDPPKTTFLIVGGGPYFKELKKEAENLCRGMSVIFTDMVSPDEVPDYYKLGDIFVSASTSETQGLTYVEALANGLPALCRKDPCLENVVVDNENGFVYENFEDFKKYAEKMLTDDSLRAALSQGALESSKKFSTYAFAERAVEIYEKALKDKENGAHTKRFGF